MHEHIHGDLGIHIGDFLIPYYGIMIICGLVAAFFVGYFQIKKYKLNKKSGIKSSDLIPLTYFCNCL